MRRARISLAAACAATLATLGCGAIEIPMELNLVEGETTLELDVGGPGGFSGIANLEGGISAIMAVPAIGFFHPSNIIATVTITGVRLAGDPIPIPALGANTGTICVTQDPNDPSGGSALLNLKSNVATFDTHLGGLTFLTDEGIGALAEDGIPLGVDLVANTVVTLGQLLDVAAGKPGALVLPVDVSGEIPALLPPVIQKGTYTLNAVIQNDTVQPQNANLSACDDFFSQPNPWNGQYPFP